MDRKKFKSEEYRVEVKFTDEEAQHKRIDDKIEEIN